jgi:hypothetical protein
MEKQEFFIEIMKSSRSGKNQAPTTKRGKIKIYPKSKGHIHKVFANYGWMVTTLTRI